MVRGIFVVSTFFKSKIDHLHNKDPKQIILPLFQHCGLKLRPERNI